MSKKINLKDTVYKISKEYPEFKDIMVELGFKDIVKPVAMETLGKVMTLAKGAAIKDIPLDQIIETLEAAGFEIVSEDGQVRSPKNESPQIDREVKEDATRVDLLKSYIHRINDGDSLENVQKDFVKNFKSVDSSEIAKAEQEIISEGTPVAEVQKLCDVHSALFHGLTEVEQEPQDKTLALAQTPGHPVNIYMRENEIIEKLIANVRAAQGDQIFEAITKLGILSSHYASQGDLIYPLLSRAYDFAGPSNVMWGVDDEIRDELRLLIRSGKTLTGYKERIEAVLTRAEEMIYKENSILLPLCIDEFSEEDWMRIYYEMTSYPTCLPEAYPIWEEAEKRRESLRTIGGMTAERFKEEDLKQEEAFALGSGRMTIKQIEHVLNTIPMELTFVDDKDINSYHNKGLKIFKRPDMAIGRDVWACHPPKVETIVREIIDAFKAGTKDVVEVWMVKDGEPVLVKYLAVRDEESNYVGTLEAVQLMGFAKDHFTKQ